MKPSEMLNKMGYLNLKRKLNKSEIKELNELGLIEHAVIAELLKKANNDLDKLDKRFIDREELKEKIKNSKISMNIDTEYYDGCRYAIKKILKILEMLK